MTTKFIIKFLMWIMLLGIVFGSAYYTGILQQIPAQINVVNQKFLIYIPVEYRYLFGFLVFVIIYISIENKRE